MFNNLVEVKELTTVDLVGPESGQNRASEEMIIIHNNHLITASKAVCKKTNLGNFNKITSQIVTSNSILTQTNTERNIYKHNKSRIHPGQLANVQFEFLRINFAYMVMVEFVPTLDRISF